MHALEVNPKPKAPKIPSWVKWAATAAVGTIVSWHVSRTLERYAALKEGDVYQPPPPPENP